MSQFRISGTNPSERMEAYLATEKSFALLYEAGEKAGDEAKMEEARNLHKALAEQLAAEGQDYVQMFQLMVRAYKCKREILNLDDYILEERIPWLVATFRKFGITCFTISGDYSSMNKTIWAFTQQPGVRLIGMMEIVANPMTQFGKNEPEKEPAFLFYIVV